MSTQSPPKYNEGGGFNMVSLSVCDEPWHDGKGIPVAPSFDCLHVAKRASLVDWVNHVRDWTTCEILSVVAGSITCSR